MSNILQILLILTCSLASVDGKAAEQLELSEAIQEVSTGGFWSLDDQSGTFRVVVQSYGNEHSYSETYAQWIGVSPTGDPRIVASVKIAKLSDAPLFIVQDVRFLSLSKLGSGEFAVTIAKRYSEEVKEVRILLGAPGVYSVEDPDLGDLDDRK
jgi:hypothetical protein